MRGENPLDLDRMEIEAPAYPVGTALRLTILISILLWLLIGAFILGITST